MKYLAYTDGGSRNNTHASCAWIITNEANEIIHSNSCYLGGRTSNEAEYMGLILCLTSAVAGGIKHLVVTQDSELVSRQMNGEYQVKASNLKPLHDTAMCLSRQFDSIAFNWSGREHPLIGVCDKLCDQMIDSYKK